MDFGGHLKTTFRGWSATLASPVWTALMEPPKILSGGLLVALPKRRRLVLAVRNHAMMLGPASIWASDWVSVLPSAVTAEDGNAWLHSVGILVMWVAFSGTLHWSAAGAHLARWIFIGGLGLFGPCLSLVLCMVLRPPFKL